MVDKAKIEKIVADTMAANTDLEGIVVCEPTGKVIFGHMIAGGIRHVDVAGLAVKIAADASQLVKTLEKGGLREVTIASELGVVVILGDVKMVVAGIAGKSAHESIGLLRMALKRALLEMVE